MTAPLTLSDPEFKLFRDLIYRHSGISFTELNRCVLESRLRERIGLLGFDSFYDYYLMLRDLPPRHPEIRQLLGSVTTNLTSFFRYNQHFEALERHILPELAERRRATGSRTIKFWSAGCSTGEEAYSIAMAVHRTLPNPSAWDVEIVASDICLESLELAERGLYAHERLAGVPAELRRRYFHETMHGHQVKDTIRDWVTFDYHNLINPIDISNIDIVFCRNVIIYFDDASARRVMELCHRAMAPGGYLFLGHSESLFSISDQFSLKKVNDVFVYQKDEQAAGQPGLTGDTDQGWGISRRA